MNEFSVIDVDDNSVVLTLVTTCSDMYILNSHMINFNKIQLTEDDPEYWNKKFRKNDWDHLYD